MTLSAISQERKRVDTELKRMGLGGLEDRNLCTQIAFFIRNHEQFRGMLMAVTEDKRHLAYKALAPKLKFPAKPLEVYEREIKEKAEREQWPTLKQGEVYPEAFRVAEVGEKERIAKRIEEALPEPEMPKERHLTLTCVHCLKEETFSSWSRVLADLKASDAGWFTENDKSYCPEHAPTVQ